MKLKTVFTFAAVYLGVLGIAFMIAPQQAGIEAVPADASPMLIAYLRVFGGPLVGIAVLNWMARNEGPSSARNAIVLANIIGFGCVATMDIWAVAGGDARQLQKLFLVIHLLMTVSFILAGRSGVRAR